MTDTVKRHLERGGRAYVSVKGVFKQADSYEQWLALKETQRAYRASIGAPYK